MVEWDETLYGTGDSTVDEQHQKLFEMVNVLLDNRRREVGEVRKLLSFLGEYVIQHFQEEEIIMAERRCPVAELNRQEHARFIAAFTQFMADFERDGITPELTQRIRAELLDWLVHHITKVDRQLLKTKAPARPVAAVVVAPKKGGGMLGWLGQLFTSPEKGAAGSGTRGADLHGLDFAAAVDNHSQLRARLLAVLDGTSTERLVPAELMRDDACPLGQWLLGAGREHFGQATAFQAVDRAHEKFHLEAGRVLTMAQSGPEGRGAQAARVRGLRDGLAAAARRPDGAVRRPHLGAARAEVREELLAGGETRRPGRRTLYCAGRVPSSTSYVPSSDVARRHSVASNLAQEALHEVAPSVAVLRQSCLDDS